MSMLSDWLEGQTRKSNAEARDSGVRLIWQCSSCYHERTGEPGVRERGPCSCGGSYYFIELVTEGGGSDEGPVDLERVTP